MPGNYILIRFYSIIYNYSFYYETCLTFSYKFFVFFQKYQQIESVKTDIVRFLAEHKTVPIQVTDQPDCKQKSKNICLKKHFIHCLSF